MNSHISDIDTVQADDIAGAEALYAKGPPYQSGPDAPVLRNLSTRGFVGTGKTSSLVALSSRDPSRPLVILRAIGLSLSAGGITGALEDPMITVYDSDQNQIATNDDWFISADAETIASFHLDPSNSRESALYLTLQPGAYTAVVQSFTDAQSPPTTGVGLFELYDLSTTGGRAGNISTRGEVLGRRQRPHRRHDHWRNRNENGDRARYRPIVRRSRGSPIPSPIRRSTSTTVTAPSCNRMMTGQQGPDAQTIIDAGLAPMNSKESALYAILSPGVYTVDC